MYRESFAEEWQEHTMKSPQQIRVQAYRRLTEKCDEDHNCGSGAKENGAKPFLHAPIWQ